MWSQHLELNKIAIAVYVGTIKRIYLHNTSFVLLLIAIVTASSTLIEALYNIN